MPLVTSTINQSARMVARRVRPGDTVVDATAGNGNDTVFLAGLVGDGGVVHAFDVQEEALGKTRERLAREGMDGRVRLHHAGHEGMLRVLGEDALGTVRAAMFNLGFLPGSDSAVATSPETTLAGLNASLALLTPGGLLSVVCYTGHDGGAEELAAVEGWARDLDFDRCRVLRHEVFNKPGSPIVLLLVEMLGQAISGRSAV